MIQEPAISKYFSNLSDTKRYNRKSRVSAIASLVKSGCIFFILCYGQPVQSPDCPQLFEVVSEFVVEGQADGSWCANSCHPAKHGIFVSIQKVPNPPPNFTTFLFYNT